MYYQDFEVGDVYTTDSVTLHEQDIIAFAEVHDPQPMHTDPKAAVESIYGGLIASGWQVLSLTFGLTVKAGIFDGGGQGSPGLDEVRWLRPVRPGDTIHIKATIESMRHSRNRADRGYIDFRFEVVNQDDEVVASYLGHEIFALRS